MRLYRIKRKDYGLYLNCSVPRIDIETPHYLDRYWGTSGLFWKRIDTVASKLKDLCSDWKTGCKMSPYNNTGLYKETRLAYHPERAEKYMVEFFDVTVDKVENIEASDLIPDFKRKDHLR